MILRPVFCCLLAIFSLAGTAQEQLGLRLNNYSGIHGTLFNPAFNVNSPQSWDINLIAGGVFIENNYAYLLNTSMRGILTNNSNFTFAGSTSNETNPDDIQYDFTICTRKKALFVNAFIILYSVYFMVKK